MGVADDEAVPALPQVILGTTDGLVRALNGLDGSTRWQFAAGSNHPFFSSALAADQGLVYAAAGDGLICALRLDNGRLLWQYQLPYAGPPVGHRFDLDVRVAAGGGVVAVSMGRQDTRRKDARSITVLDGATGAQRWVFTPRPPAWIRFLHALGPVTDYFPDPGGAMLMAADGSGVYVTSSRQQAGKRPTCVTAVHDLLRGRQRWRTRRAAAQVQIPSMSSRTSLAVADGMVYTLDTHLSALAAATGRVRWQRPAPPASRPGVLAADAMVVCAACESLFAVYRARDGAALWQLDGRNADGSSDRLLGMVLMDEMVYVSRAVASRRNGFAMEARDATTGVLRWVWPIQTPPGPGHEDGQGQELELELEQAESPARGDLSWRFVGSGGVLYVPGHRTLCAVRASDGAQLWQMHTGFGLPALVAVPV